MKPVICFHLSLLSCVLFLSENIINCAHNLKGFSEVLIILKDHLCPSTHISKSRELARKASIRDKGKGT